ncbi:hypothetical protein JXA05_00115 [Candidatus Peregrinibacteria bacterium]|nr:hypothetical protein [Candidatus Peregrinibacteria bacterium]
MTPIYMGNSLSYVSAHLIGQNPETAINDLYEKLSDALLSPDPEVKEAATVLFRQFEENGESPETACDIMKKIREAAFYATLKRVADTTWMQ